MILIGQVAMAKMIQGLATSVLGIIERQGKSKFTLSHWKNLTSATPGF